MKTNLVLLKRMVRFRTSAGSDLSLGAEARACADAQRGSGGGGGLKWAEGHGAPWFPSFLGLL